MVVAARMASKFSVGVVATCAALSWCSASSYAHDHWINKYKMPTNPTIGCCGKNDCSVIAPGDVQVRADGYYIKSLDELVPFEQTYNSEDFQYWRCRMGDGTRRCFFAPSAS